MVTYIPYIVDGTEVMKLITNGIEIGVVITFSMGLTGLVINKIIKIMMGSV
jgi:hypothetical protein